MVARGRTEVVGNGGDTGHPTNVCPGFGSQSGQGMLAESSRKAAMSSSSESTVSLERRGCLV